MRNEVERFEAEAVGPVVPPDDRPRAQDLKPSDASFPCPGQRPGDCRVADWLTSAARAGQVYAYLDALADDRRRSDEWNDLGCALGWAGEWPDAAEAFRKAMNGATDQQRQRAEANLAIANKDEA